MGTLVVHHLTELAAEVQALEVPAVQVQRIAMDVHQREIITGTLIDLGVQYDAVRCSDVRPIGPEGEECRKVGFGGSGDPLGDDPAFQLNSQRDSTSRQRCEASQQSEARGQPAPLRRHQMCSALAWR